MRRRLTLAMQRFEQVELKLCLCLNRSTGLPSVTELFRAVDWLGKGWFWYALMVCLPWLYGRAGALVGVQMAAAGLAGVTVYKIIKRSAVRERPFVTHATIWCASVPMDRYSFPSGHTLHAVLFTVLIVHAFPAWAAPLAAFTALIALSRMVLGLHYPTDVAAGAALGGGLAALSLVAASW